MELSGVVGEKLKGQNAVGVQRDGEGGVSGEVKDKVLHDEGLVPAG